MLAALERKRDVVEQDATVDRQPQTRCLDNRPTAARRLQELEAEPPGAALQYFDLACGLRALLLETSDLRQLRLRLACHLRRRRTEARNKSL